MPTFAIRLGGFMWLRWDSDSFLSKIVSISPKKVGSGGGKVQHRERPDCPGGASNFLLLETNPPMADEHLLTHGPFTRSVADILRGTLLKLEQMPEFRQDNPAVIELKRHIVRSIAELEI